MELAEEDRHARDLRTEELRNAFLGVTVCLPIYRTYIRDTEISERDRAHIENALAAAGTGPEFDFLRRVLLVEPAWYLQHRKADYLDFVMRWQQFTGPVMAKGLEDTTFYGHNPLVSVNEVGGDFAGPEGYFGIEEFHRRNLKRHADWPHSMNATSTHDTKRSEDVRTRINVLSELPDEWAESLGQWMRMHPRETGPDANEQILIYQSLLGAWPIEADRLKQYVTKALREAKRNTKWTEINEEYERSVLAFVDTLYASEDFLSDFESLQKKVAYYGALSSLSQLVLKATSPGVPDFYRGTEFWDLSLTDPDNRRPVDFSLRMDALRDLQGQPNVQELLNHWPDGRLKMYLTQKLLHFRREHSELFLQGEYIPLRVKGALSNHVVAFARRLHQQWCIVAVGRLYASLAEGWHDTEIELPAEAPSSWRNVFTGAEVASPDCSVLFKDLPVAVLAFL
jgi:(1->4)-alpha-D-glucan 1-alpha-D-glucosylmutase